MRNVTQQFYLEQFAEYFKPVKKVLLYRRFASSEVWEGDPIDITDLVDEVSDIRILLDIEQYNVWKKQNLNFTAKNDNNEWARDSELFDGFSRYRSKIEIQVGFQVGDNLKHDLEPYMTGLITSVEDDTTNQMVKVQIVGLSVLLEEADAENVGIIHSDQPLVKINNLEWRTSQTGIQKVTEIRHAGLLLEVGEDYDITNLGVYDDFCYIKFTTNRVANITGTYIQSYIQSYDIDLVLERLLQEAGFSAGQYFVDNLALEGETYSQIGDINFGAGTGYRIVAVSGDLRLDIDGGTGKYYEDGWFNSQIFNVSPFDSWTYLEIEPVFPGGNANIRIFTRSWFDATGILTEPWVEIGGDGRIMSTSGGNNYIQYRIEFSNYNTNDTPIINKINIYYRQTAGVGKKLYNYNFTGMNVKEAIDEFLKFGNYENGFTGEGIYFFRRRKTIISAMELTDGQQLVEIKEYSDGFDRVVNRVLAEYGSSKMVRDATGSPTSEQKYGLKIFELESQLLVDEDRNLVRRISDNLLFEREDPNQVVRFITRYLPALEIGDLCRVTYKDKIDMTARITGLILHFREWNMEMYFEEQTL